MRSMLLLMVCLAALAFTSSVVVADWQMRVTDGVTIEVLHDNTPIVKADYLFWGANWKWAGTEMRLAEDGKSCTGRVRDLGLRLTGVITKPAENALRIEYQIEATQAHTGIIGGGIEWSLWLDSPSFAQVASDPELLPDSRGWRWHIADGEAINVSFQPALPSVYFERGNKGQIRTFLLGADVAQGMQTITMTIAIPEGGVVAKPLAERYGPADTSTWTPDALLWNRSPIDLSFLNH